MTSNTSVMRPSRRTFLKASAAAGGGLIIAGYLPAEAMLEAQRTAFEPNVWVKIGADNSVRVMLSMLELGQGVMTAMPMLLAEELDVDWNTLTTEWAPADRRYGNPNFGGSQTTAGSNSTRGMWRLLREAGAGARMMLVAAAAQTWSVPESSLTTRRSNPRRPTRSSAACARTCISGRLVPDIRSPKPTLSITSRCGNSA